MIAAPAFFLPASGAGPNCRSSVSRGSLARVAIVYAGPLRCSSILYAPGPGPSRPSASFSLGLLERGGKRTPQISPSAGEQHTECGGEWPRFRPECHGSSLHGLAHADHVPVNSEVRAWRIGYAMPDLVLRRVECGRCHRHSHVRGWGLSLTLPDPDCLRRVSCAGTFPRSKRPFRRLHRQ